MPISAKFLTVVPPGRGDSSTGSTLFVEVAAVAASASGLGASIRLRQTRIVAPAHAEAWTEVWDWVNAQGERAQTTVDLWTYPKGGGTVYKVKRRVEAPNQPPVLMRISSRCWSFGTLLRKLD
jgi:hypothetical protein